MKDKKNIDSINEILKIVNSSPYYKHLNIRAVESKNGRSIVKMGIKDEHMNLYKTAHGGAIASLADSACNIALLSKLKEGETTVTVDIRINYLVPPTKGILTAFGKVVYRGNTIAVEEVDIKNENGLLLTKAIATNFIRSEKQKTSIR